jgi:hydrogenase maturation factor
MCVSEAGLVLAVEGDEVALVSVAGSERRVPLIVVTGACRRELASGAGDGETVAPGDWLLIHTGLAVARITAEEADFYHSLPALGRKP